MEQLEHTEAEVAPSIVEYSPAIQLTQLKAPVLATYAPAGQLEQEPPLALA